MAKRERWIAGGRLAGAGEVALRVEGGRVAEVADHPPKSAEVISLRGHWLAPFAVDAHVHLAFAAGMGASDAADESLAGSKLGKLLGEMLAGGVGGALDLGCPQALLPELKMVCMPTKMIGTATNLVAMQTNIVGTATNSQEPSVPAKSLRQPFTVAFSGPLLCAPRGYPTQSWGRDGYGLAVATPEEVRAAVDGLHAQGAAFAKLSFDGRFPSLAPEVAAAIVLEARKLGMKTAAHALEQSSVKAALAAGVEILAHTPVEPLDESIVKEAGARKMFVLSTLQAFGASREAKENLARLAAAGCRPIYGTDLGNEGTSPGLSELELRALVECGISCAQILAMCTRDAAALLGEPSLGNLQPGAPANFLVLAEDPLRDPAALCRPAQRFLAGEPLAAN